MQSKLNAKATQSEMADAMTTVPSASLIVLQESPGVLQARLSAWRSIKAKFLLPGEFWRRPGNGVAV